MARFVRKAVSQTTQIFLTLFNVKKNLCDKLKSTVLLDLFDDSRSIVFSLDA